jgi:hypothetical protein
MRTAGARAKMAVDVIRRGAGLISFAKGSTRTVVTVGRYAFKFARHRCGMRCNRSEAHTFRSTTDQRRSMLCPVLWCSGSGLLLIAQAAAPVTEGEASHLRAARGFPDWDYAGPEIRDAPSNPERAIGDGSTTASWPSITPRTNPVQRILRRAHQKLSRPDDSAAAPDSLATLLESLRAGLAAI